MSNVLANITIAGDLNIGDILTVVTSRAETSFTNSLTETKNRVEQLGKEIAAKDTLVSKKTKEEALALVEEKAAAVRVVIEPLGGKVKTDSHGINGENNVVGAITICPNEKGYSVQYFVTAPASPELLTLKTELQALVEQKSAAVQEGLAWKKKLQGIPQLERQYRAKIAEAKLSESDDGQRVLEILTSDLESNMLLLPGN